MLALRKYGVGRVRVEGSKREEMEDICKIVNNNNKKSFSPSHNYQYIGSQINLTVQPEKSGFIYRIYGTTFLPNNRKSSCEEPRRNKFF